MTGSVEHVSGTLLPYALEALQDGPDPGGQHLGIKAMSAAGILLVAGALTDDVVGRRTARGAEPSVRYYPPAEGAPTNVITFFGGGFNSCAAAAADVYSQTVTEFGHMYALTDPKSGFDAKANCQTVTEICQELKPDVIIHLGNSMRTLKNLPVARHLKEVLGVENRIVGVCSPYGIRTVRGASRLRGIWGLDGLYHTGIRGGKTIRVIAETGGYAVDHAGEAFDLPKAIRHARRKVRMLDMPTNPMVLTDAHIIRHYVADDDLAALSDVPFAYVRPENPDEDNVVDNLGAMASYQAGLVESIIDVTSPLMRHANPCDMPADEVRSVMRRTYYALAA